VRLTPAERQKTKKSLIISAAAAISVKDGGEFFEAMTNENR